MNFAPTGLISFGLCGFLHRGRPEVGCWILWSGAEAFKVAFYLFIYLFSSLKKYY